MTALAVALIRILASPSRAEAFGGYVKRMLALERRSAALTAELDDARRALRSEGVRPLYIRRLEKAVQSGSPEAIAVAKATILGGSVRDRVGYVYFIRCTASGRIKIGFSEDVAARFAGIRRQSSVDVELLFFSRGSVRDEADLHDRFAAHCHHSEWYEPASPLLAEIDRRKAEDAL